VTGADRPPSRPALRLAAGLLVAGDLLSLVAGALHPGREAPNAHAAVFAECADSAAWVAVHLGQFAGMALLIAGLLALDAALRDRASGRDWAARFGAAAPARRGARRRGAVCGGVPAGRGRIRGPPAGRFRGPPRPAE
jgi:hypothetical protein